jgi:DNA gyrase subunit A|tara:strand:+ start:11462 stop:14257 length:2796 start_codon:yes stop_codon:yes gene_type:complete
LTDQIESSIPPDNDVSPVTIEDEMRSSYLSYAMSVIVSRALPDVRDGLKPVHRRILYAMKVGGYEYNRPYRKSAQTVGEVMGKYHPHGDSAIYDAMVRMAQYFSLRLELIDGQGNFGSMDGDPPAAMRYTESRMSKAAHALIEDIDRDTVDFQPTYDESRQEPVVLPAQYPNLLVNGAGGIAVGMATNIPPHNLGEVIDACCAYIDDPNLSIDDLMQYMKGPDFPTGGLIIGSNGVRSAFHTGRGSVLMRARTHFEDIVNGRKAVVITEIPYQVNKSRMIERIAEIANDKTVEGISDLRDESDRQGLRVVVELKKDSEPEVVLAQLFRYTPLQTTFGVNMLALNGGQPELLDIKRIISAFVEFREEVITRRTIYELSKARDRAHVLVGLAVAIANLDDAISIIRSAKDAVTARAVLKSKKWPALEVTPLIELIDEPGRGVDEENNYVLSDEQAKAILELRLHRLTGLERDKIAKDLSSLVDEIREYLSVLESRQKLFGIMKSELLEMREEFADSRRTEIIDAEFEHDLEDLIQREDMVVTVTHGGYIKRVPLSNYRAQRRGGKGRAGMATRDDDFVSQVFVLNTHTPVLFFSSKGMVYKMKVYKLPIGSPTGRGKAMVNLLPLEEGETITTLMPLPEDEESWNDLFVMFATSSGNVRRNRLSDFVQVKANGKIAMKLGSDDHLIGVATCDEKDDILLATTGAKCIRFKLTDVRVFQGRNSTGVRGIKLPKGVKVISMSLLNHTDYSTTERAAYLKRSRVERLELGVTEEVADSERFVEDDQNFNDGELTLSDDLYKEMALREQFVLTVTAKGFGKRSSAYEYRVAGRGGQGIANIDLAKIEGNSVVSSFPVESGTELVMMTDGGQLIRTGVSEIRIAGRSTRGVTLFRIATDENVVTVTPMHDDTSIDSHDKDEEGETLPSSDDALEEVDE